MAVNVTEERRGPALLLYCSFVRSTTCKKQETDDIVIDDLAAVKIGLQYDTSRNSYDFYFQSMKLDLEKNITINMNVSCENPSYQKQVICGADWSDKDIGDVTTDCACYVKEHNMFYFKIHISVRKIDKPTFCTKMFLDTDFTDFSLSAVNGIVAVHKIVLASHSDVFKAMLNGEWKETVEGQITLKGTTRESLQHLKDYMYLDILPEEGLCPLLLIADRYLIEHLKTRCLAKLVDTLTSENLYDLLDFACHNNIPELAYEILHVTPSKIIHTAYQKSKKNNSISSKSAETK